MPVGRYFRGLTAFDLLGNLVPGTILLTFIVAFLPDPPIPESLGSFALFSVLAFSVGSIVQAHASKAVGDRVNFKRTMISAEDLPNLSGDGTKSSGEPGNCTGSFCSFAISNLHAIFGPVIWPIFPARGKKLDDAILVNRIWSHLVDEYDIPYNTESFDVMYRIMCSKVDDIRSPGRATRIQAIRNFHRGMWVTSWHVSLLLGLSILLNGHYATNDSILLGIQYSEPGLFSYWTPLWQVFPLSLVSVLIFWYLFERSEEDYIEYLFTDYAVSITSRGTEVNLSSGSNLELLGNLSTTIEHKGEEQDLKSGDN